MARKQINGLIVEYFPGHPRRFFLFRLSGCVFEVPANPGARRQARAHHPAGMSDVALPWPALLAMGLALRSQLCWRLVALAGGAVRQPSPTATDLLARLLPTAVALPHCHTRLR